MKIKIPRRLKFGPHIYEVSKSSTLRRDKGDFGHLDYLEQTIQVDGSLPITEMTVAFLHELTHLSAHVFGGCVQPEEPMIESFANGMLCFLQEIGIELDWKDIKGE